MLGVFTPLVTDETALVSDELNHNCIINAIKLARPKEKRVYRHNDVAELDARLAEVAGRLQARPGGHRRHLLDARRPRAAAGDLRRRRGRTTPLSRRTSW